MSAKILDGKALSKRLLKDLKKEVEQLKIEGLQPGLGIVMVGEDPASQVYVNSKLKKAKKIGIDAHLIQLKQEISEFQLLEEIEKLNSDPTIHGFIVQLPLPPHINQDKIIEAIDPKKDVDGFHPYNMGKLLMGNPSFIPATALGVMKLIQESSINISGKQALVVGRSNIVGKPVAALLLQQNATVTVAHSKTTNLPELVADADILVVSVGRPELIPGDWIKQGAVVIDVGINKLPNGRLTGDVEFSTASTKAGFITPVPGGVGPMTVTMLLANTVEAIRRFA